MDPIKQLLQNKTEIVKKKILLWALVYVLPPILIVSLVFLLLGGIGIYQTQKSEDPKGVELQDTDWIITPHGTKIIPAQYLAKYQQVGKKYGVPWNILAALHSVETTFGTNLKVSKAGAVGHFQVRT